MGKLSSTPRRFAFCKQVPVISLGFFLLLLSYSNYRNHRSLILPPANFSEGYKMYEILKEENQSILFIGNPCWASIVMDFYWDFIGSTLKNYPNRKRFQLVPKNEAECLRIDLTDGSPSGRQVQDFLNKERGVVILYSLFHECSFYKARGTGISVKVRKLSINFPDRTEHNGCYLVIGGARELNQIKSVAFQNGFPMGSATLN